FAAVTLTLAWVPYFGVWCVVFLPAGVAWRCCVLTLDAVAQAAVPRWGPGAAMSGYLLVVFCGVGLRGGFWGVLAGDPGAPRGVTAAAGWALLDLLVALRYRLPHDAGAGLEPSRRWGDVEAAPGIEMDHGPVLITVDYRIDPERRAEFLKAILPLR